MKPEICKLHNIDHTGTICGACYEMYKEQAMKVKRKAKINDKNKLYYNKEFDIMCLVHSNGLIEKYLNDLTDLDETKYQAQVWYVAKDKPTKKDGFIKIGEF